MPMPQPELTVRQLNMYVRSLIEGDINLSSVRLVGEISNLKRHYSSGHWYFVLKDSYSSIRCIMFKSNCQRVKFIPEDGNKVVCNGYVSLYERDGQYQFYAESMEPSGKGSIAEEFERIKKKLESEGLFDPLTKKNLPAFPKKLGIITSKDGAALQDILNVTLRRYPICEIVLFPAVVQGENAPDSLISALDRAEKYKDLDLIIIGRGGGSAEDLSCFNSEKLAYRIHKAFIPIISAVGHETDFTICDFVSDLRAPTPSAAAEMAVPSSDELFVYIKQRKQRIIGSVNKILSINEQKFEGLKSKRCFLKPGALFSPFEQRLCLLSEKFTSAYDKKLSDFTFKLEKLSVQLEGLSPESVFKRGYSVILKNNKTVFNAHEINRGDKINIRMKNGNAECLVEKVTINERQR